MNTFATEPLSQDLRKTPFYRSMDQSFSRHISQEQCTKDHLNL